VPFGVHTMADNISGFIFPQTVKNGLLRHVQVATNGFETNDVIED